jgi:exodeoxyribonuclease V alpha subunit
MWISFRRWGRGGAAGPAAATEVVPRVRLTKIFRQAQTSGIVVNAHRVNAGSPPRLRGFPDFYWFTCEDTEQTAALTADIVAHRIPRRFGMDPRRDIQVLAPMHRGLAGVGVITAIAQEDGKLTVLTAEDESLDYGFDELDELAHRINAQS